MATPILGRTGNPFLFVAYGLIALSLWMVDREIGGQSSQPTSVINPDTASGGSSHFETYASFVLPQNDTLYRPASTVLDELVSDESSAAENHDKDHEEKRHRAAIALMVYLATDGIRR